MKVTNISEVPTASIIMAVTALFCDPKDSHLRTLCIENFKLFLYWILLVLIGMFLKCLWQLCLLKSLISHMMQS